MEKRIDLEKRGRAANQITELNLDNCRSTNIVGLTDDFTALEALSLINVGLTTLKGFPKLPNLTRLELSDNRISSGLSNLSTSPKLTHLNISGNRIKDLEELKALENFKSLQVLDLFNNEATAIDGYRKNIFVLIPSLKYLDGFDANDEEVTDEEDDDELNGNESEGDDGDAFCINGMEIDLKELDDFEQKLNSKRQLRFHQEDTNSNNSRPNESSEIDEIDEYLTQLAIDIQDRRSNELSDSRRTNVSNHTNVNGDTSIAVCNKEIAKEASGLAPATISAQLAQPPPPPPPLPYPVLMYWLLSIIFFVNTVEHTVKPTLSDEMGEDEDDDDDDGDEEEDDDDEEDCGEVSLAEVYNDDFEEDNSDYVEEAEGEDGDGEVEDEDDVDSDDDEAAAAVAAAPAGNNRAPEDAAEEESPARGKKRKHDG